MKKFFRFLLLVIAVLVISPSVNLSAYSQETVDESIIQPSWPVLHQAILRQEFDKALRILEILPQQAKEKTDSNKYALNNFNTLELAILADAPIEFIETLIALGADVNANREKNLGGGYQENRTPLFAAWIMKNEEVIELLLNNGADELHVLYESFTISWWADGDYPIYKYKTEKRWISLHELMNEDN